MKERSKTPFNCVIERKVAMATSGNDLRRRTEAKFRWTTKSIDTIYGKAIKSQGSQNCLREVNENLLANKTKIISGCGK